MDDAVRATVELMKAPIENIKIRTAYNLGAMSFDPSEITAEIKQTYPDFQVDYCPDSRQLIAEKWPKSIDDSEARSDWGWKPEYNLTTMTTEMIEKLKEKYNTIKLK